MIDKELRKSEALEKFGRLIDIIDTLRSPDGCPWDKKQTHQSLKPYLIEEAYEVIDAIDEDSKDDLREELGDVLLQIMLHSQIGFEDESFHIGDVISGLSKKMITRHPHVFADVTVKDENDVLANWESIKSEEKPARGLFDGLPSSLPALLMAFRMGQKTSRVGFDWENVSDVRDKVNEELNELDEAVQKGVSEEIEHELGDILFAVSQWGRHLGYDPEQALLKSCKRFKRRFFDVEQQVAKSGKKISDFNIEELEAFWKKAKSNESNQR